MLNYRQVVFCLFSLSYATSIDYGNEQVPLGVHRHETPKSIAIVGAGSAGLAALKSLLDLPEATRTGWDIVLYEQRRDVGGVWLPDPHEPNPPTLPETPLYPSLRTNTPHPTMTYPGFPFPPFTPLYPNHEFVQRYHADFAAQYGLSRYIRLNNTVLATSWVGNSTIGKWNVTVRDHQDQTMDKSFDHLIVASGHNHYPYVPTWVGQDEWLRNRRPSSPKREILHAMFWRGPEKYAGRTVLVVGGGASGRDAVLHTTPVARRLYLSLKDGRSPPNQLPFSVEQKPAISHFTADAVFFVDGTSTPDVDSLILGTGYELRIPFLNAGNALVTEPRAHSNATYSQGLVTNLRYLFPLYEHIFSLAPQYPPTTLAFVGLPLLIANCPSDTAQALLVAHAIADPRVLPSRTEMLEQLAAREAALRVVGYDPYVVGHRLVGDTRSQDYQDELVQYLKDRGTIPDDGKKFVEEWRRRARENSSVLWRAWMRIEEHGTVHKWLQGVDTEDEWAQLMERLAAWEVEREREDDRILGYWQHST